MKENHPTMARVFERTGLDPSALALRINASPQNITNWSRRGISKKGALAVAKEFGYSVDWVLTGEDERQIDRYMKVVSCGPETPELFDREAIFQQLLTPVLDWDATGKWDKDLVEEYTVKPGLLSEKGFALKVHGQSMSPVFKPRDLIYVETELEPKDLKDGDFVIVKLIGNKDAILRQIVIGEVFEDKYLKALNPSFADQETIVLDDSYELIGKVIGSYIEFP